MSNQLDNELINSLAVSYAQTGDGMVFEKLFSLIQPMIHNQAVKAERDTGIPKETFLSLFNEDVWQAVKGEAVRGFNGSSNFTQRLHSFFKCSVTDCIRYETAERRSFSVEYLDRPVGDHSDNISYGELIPLRYSLETEVSDADWLVTTLERFRRSNERHGKVIEMILHGYTNEEIATAFGSSTYDDRVRQLVRRARVNFRGFLDSMASYQTH